MTLAYETKNNPPRALGEGTTIDWSNPGESIELLCLAAEQVDAAVEFKRMPWARGLHLLEFSQIDGLFHASFTADRQMIAVYPMAGGHPDASRAIFVQSYYLYVADNSALRWDGDTLGGLGGKPVGIGRGYSVAKELTALGASLEEEDTAQANFAKLLAGRVAAVAELDGMAAAALRGLPGASRIHKLPIAVRSQPYYLLLSRDLVAARPELAERLWNAIRSVNTSSAFVPIRLKYEPES